MVQEVCSREGCTADARVRGICRRHYAAEWALTKYNKDPEHRKLMQEESRARQRVRRATEPSYLAEQRAASRAWRESHLNKETLAAYQREWKYGFTPDLVRKLRALQRGLCAICKRLMRLGARAFDSEVADHCHATDKPRGLLCSTCNKGLGLYESRQRAAGLRIPCYEDYITSPPVASVEQHEGREIRRRKPRAVRESGLEAE